MSSILPKIRSLWLRSSHKVVLQILAIIFLLGFVGVLIYFFHDVESLKGLLPYGYGGVFLVMLIGSATVIFPVPGELVVWGAGAILPFYWVGVVASIGGALGEITGYGAGYWGQGIANIEQRQMYQRAKHWMSRYGSPVIFLFALTPLPFDVVGIASGALKFPLWKFILACWAGRLPRSILVAYLGSISVKFFFPGLF